MKKFLTTFITTIACASIFTGCASTPPISTSNFETGISTDTVVNENAENNNTKIINIKIIKKTVHYELK